MAKRKRNKRKEPPKPQEPVGPTRRGFGKGLAALLGLAATPPAIWGLSKLFQDDKVTEGVPNYNDSRLYNDPYEEWRFLERRPEPTLNDVNEITRRYVPLGPEIPFLPNEKQRPALVALLKKESAKRGFDLSQPYSTYLTEQKYGVPENAVFSKQLLEYCKNAEKLLRDRVKGLDFPSLDWVVLSHGDNYKRDVQNKALIGNSLYDVLRTRVINDRNESQRFVIGDRKHRSGSYATLDDPKTELVEPRYAFIGTGPSAIVAPFSEIIPLATDARARKAFRDNDEFHQAQETLSEGVAYVLSYEMVQKYNIPGGAKHIEFVHSNIASNPRYKYVPQAIKWIQKHGLQAAFDLYMKDPGKFMEQIKQ